MTPHQALQKYILCSFLYYIRYESIIEDTEYDSLARYLLECYDDWQGHRHAHLVSKGDLEAGTLYKLSYKDYPTVVVAAADMWMREHDRQNGHREFLGG